MKRVRTIVVLLLAVFSLYGQDIVGTWNGAFTIPQGELRIVFHISSVDDGYTSTLDSPDQNAYGIPVDSTFYKKPELTIKITDLNFVYVGNLGEDNVIKGTFTQMGQSFELNMTKQEE
ncbi:MAG: hypothetical protein KAR16_12150 [Bacteroidales bacterium]|nr:hypothetical protein [Bacteroidales bacterium]